MRPLTDWQPKVPGPAQWASPDPTHAGTGCTRPASKGPWSMVITMPSSSSRICRNENGSRPRISDERDELLDTGGGIAGAAFLGEERFYAVNSDVVWLDGWSNTLHRLARRWDDRCDGRAAAASARPAGARLSWARRFHDGGGRAVATAPRARSGTLCLLWGFAPASSFVRSKPAGAFSLNLLYDRRPEAGRLYGMCHDGLWLHSAHQTG